MERRPHLSQQVYDARRAKALRLVFDILFIMAVALVLLPASKDNPRTGVVVEVATSEH